MRTRRIIAAAACGQCCIVSRCGWASWRALPQGGRRTNRWVALEMERRNHCFCRISKLPRHRSSSYLALSDYDYASLELQANAAYADAITSMSNPPLKDGDIIIVHDFHLLLLPKLLRARLQGKEVTIVMALESPFPAAELFRCLPTRLDLLSGMLGADLIVLHDFSFARHLCNAATQLLGLESNPKSIEIGDRHVALAVLPLGIDVAAFQLQHNDDVMNERRNMAKDLISGTMVVGTAQQALQDAAQPMQAVMMGAGGGMMRARSQTGGFGEGTATDGGSITTIAQQQPSVAPTGPGEQMRLIVSVDRLDPVKGECGSMVVPKVPAILCPVDSMHTSQALLLT